MEPLTLDLREELRGGGEPLPRILQAVDQLAPEQGLRLLTTFEPLPLYAVLGRKGFGHESIRHGEGDWEIRFRRGAAPAPAKPAAPRGALATPATSADGWPAPSVVIDNRGLQPPEPMVRILDAFEHLGAGAVLEAVNERDPVFLYPELQARGAAIHTEKVQDGVRLLIRRGG